MNMFCTFNVIFIFNTYSIIGENSFYFNENNVLAERVGLKYCFEI